MDNNHEKLQSRLRPSRLAWVPIPAFLVAMAALWVADLRVAWPLPLLSWLVHYGSVALGVTFIVLPAARSFLADGQPSVLMLGSGVLMMDIGVTAMPIGFARSSDTAFAIFNTSVLLAALCHFVGVAITARRKMRLRRSVAWLTVAYTGGTAAMALVIWGALAGRMPVFFIDGQGGTPLRSVVVGTTVALFLVTAGLLWQTNRRAASPFFYWYALGLVLLAAGLAGSMVIAVKDSPLQWVTRFTQFLGGVYMCVAVLATARGSGTKVIPLAAVEEAWGEKMFLAGLRQQTPLWWALRYGLAAGAVAAAMGLRLALTEWVGPGLPTYVTFYPVVMVAALLGGFGPGLAATALAGVVVAYWIVPPVGEFTIASPVDRLGLVLFAGMGLFMSAVAEFYRRRRHKAAAYDREAALRESQARLATFAAATFEGIVESEAGRILDCNEQFARMLGYTTAELRGMGIAHLVVPEDRDRVIGNIRQGRELVIEHVALRKDGTRIVVEAHGQPVSPGSARRLTAVRDITERKQAETALQTTLQRFYDVLSSMSSGVLLVTDEGRVEFANQAVCDRFGLADAPADLVGLAARDMIEKIKHAYLHPDKAAARIREIVERGQPVRGEEIAMQGGGACLRDFVPLNVQGKSCGRLWLHFDITERNRVEEALRQSEERLRLLGDNLPDSAVYQYVHETDGRVQFLYFSEGIERLNGVSVPAVLRDAGELHRQIPPEWFARLVAAEAQSARDLSDFDMEVPMRRPDGQVRWMRLQSRPRRMPDGRTVWDGVQTDITARKEVEAALRESRERLDLALLSSRMATFDWDIVKNKRTWSNGVHSLLGTRPETFTGTAEEFFQVIHPADRSTVQAALAWAVECTGEYETEYRAIWPDGGTHHLSARGKVHRDSAGRAVQMTGVCWDITERKQAEEALHESEARYRNLFNAIDAGFCIVEMIFDAQGKPADYRFLEVNAAFKKQTGLQAAEGKLMRELAPAHEAQWFAIYGKIALTGEPARFVNEAKALNRWYDVYAYRVGAPESRQVAILFNDISAHKLAEAELRRQAEELRAANEELVRFNRVTVGRELRIIELKKQVNELCTRLGQPPRYASELGQEPPPTP